MRAFLVGSRSKSLDHLVAPGGVDARSQPAEQIDDLPTGEGGPQIDVAGNVGHPLVQFDGVVPRILAEHFDVTLVVTEEPHQHSDRGGLSRAVGPEEPHHLTGLNGEIQTVERFRRPERLVQIANLGSPVPFHLPC